MKQKIAIVDYGMGNLFSVQKKLTDLDCQVIITSDPKELALADKIILPGVGHFEKAIYNLKKMSLIDVLNEAVLINKKPILGICLGMQLMAKFSEEGNQSGLNWFNATASHFNISNTLKHKVPHTGWNQVKISKPSKLFKDIDDFSEFYFVHSYHVECNDTSDILTETTYETRFTSSIEKNNIYGVQFHPEKSHDDGLQLFKNFINI